MGSWAFRAISTSVLGLGLTPIALCGAWTLPAGESQSITTAQFTQAKDQFKPSLGEAASGPHFAQSQDMRIYTEYGITKNWTFVVQTGWQSAQRQNGSTPTEYYQGGTQSQFGLRRRLPNYKDWVRSVEITWIKGLGGSAATGQSFGRDGSDTDFRFNLGRNLKVKGRDGFFDGQIAYRSRSGNTRDEWHSSLTLGVDVHPKVQILAQSHIVESAGDVSNAASASGQGYSHISFDPSIVYTWSTKTRYQLGSTVSVYGKNSDKDAGVSLSVWRRF